MNLNLFLAYCDVDFNKICFVCNGCGAEYSYKQLISVFDLNLLYVRSFDVCLFNDDDFQFMITFKCNEVLCDE